MEDRDLGVIVVTDGIKKVMDKNSNFYEFAMECLFERYLNEDWGDMCEEDKALNTIAMIEGDRILASYKIPEEVGVEDDNIWIITEWDRSVTTILFPDEY